MPGDRRGRFDPASQAAAFAALHDEILPEPIPLRAAITAACRRSEQEAVRSLHARIGENGAAKMASQELARTLVKAVRAKRTSASGVDALMHEFSLSSEEGVALMCLAEALLRIPDHQTADRLIAGKISKGDWHKHLGESPSLFVNAATWGLLVTGKLVATNSEHTLGAALTRLIGKGGEALIRKGVDLAMRMLGNQFVTGQDIAEALANSRENEARGYRYSYDMLGEAALTERDAANYFAAYESAVHAIGRASGGRGIKRGPGISVKLSALHPRYSRAQRPRVMLELLPRLKKLLSVAMQYDIGLNIDAEEADRLELSLDLMEEIAFDRDLAGFNGIGFAVQAYQKRAPFVVDYLVDLAHRSGHRFMIRLVKGAYWDTEIKRAQVEGLAGYPVYTRKAYTDLCYLACAQQLLAAGDVIYPQFATHNAHTLATICTWAQQQRITDYEFQCLHGMGETLYDQVVGRDHLDQACRIYAPVGLHQTLLAYLVRRLLENGSNSSFVNQLVDEEVSIEALLADPVDTSRLFDGEPHPNIPLPANLYGARRRNSAGLDLSDESVLRNIDDTFAQLGARQWRAGPLLDVVAVHSRQSHDILNPADRRDKLGQVVDANMDDVDAALATAEAYAMEWQTVPPSERSEHLLRAADLFEAHRLELMALAIREAGKSLPNAIAEVREAVDFLRYYACKICRLPDALALGPVVCISPWNFPLAIFTGQVSAALAAGNVVLAKPAEQTPLIAHRAVQLLHQAGIPRSALQLLPGRGESVGAELIADSRVRGVVFTGSLEVAQIINRTLASRSAEESCEIPLIAETGGLNCMIVDSSALTEQVVLNVISSAFDSAGQRCSALRVLFLQDDIADKTMHMLSGAMQELRVGSPDRLSIDIGPVIDGEAQRGLLEHIDKFKVAAKSFQEFFLFDSSHTNLEHGTFVAPTIFEITSLSELKREVFGPVLHVIRYSRNQLSQLISEINTSGYGLTLGIHSRIDETIDAIASQTRVGNIYVNRNIVGAVVGVQPFGGEGKSGTGPKAGGPFYLRRLQRKADHDPDKDLMQAPNKGVTPDTPDTLALNALLSWANANGRQKLAALAGEYLGSTLLTTTLLLPGPTGERNTLSFAARGAVFCAASSTDGILNQVAAVLATGNTACVTLESRSFIPANLLADLREAIRLIDQAQDASVDLRIALVEASLAPALRIALAARDGALAPVIETREGVAIPLWRLVTERALCINTSAAGGNATLMTLGA